MYQYMFNNPEEFIAILTIMGVLLLTLLGYGDEEKEKKKLKTILLSYGIVFLLILSTGENVTFFLFVLNISLFLFGGLTHSTSTNMDLEKELNLFQFLIYNSNAWFLLTQNYILFGATLLLTVLIPILNFFELSSVIITIMISVLSLIALFIQYISVIKSYFGLKNFNVVLRELTENKDFFLNMGKPSSEMYPYNLENDKKELIAFMLYCEDKNLFERKSNTINFVDLKMKYKKPSISKNQIVIDEESKKRKYFRGYSTIEQQLVRQLSMTPFSYRYTIRRKLFNDWLYTPFLCKAICNRKARAYGKKRKKIARKELIWNLKYMLMIQYFIIVLKNPQNSNDLIEAMSNESRVSVPVYKKLYTIFLSSSEVEYYSNQIDENALRKFNFY